MSDLKYFECLTDKSPLAYRASETMVFTLRLKSESGYATCPKILWRSRGDDGVTADGIANGDTSEPLVIEAGCAIPGFVHITVQALDDNEKPLDDAVVFEGGAGADVEKIACATEIPDDFDAFWNRRIDELNSCEFNVLKKVRIENHNYDGFEVYDMKIECPGGMPISGYLTIPEGAESKSLAGAVEFIGYGVSSAPLVVREHTVCLGINAHGIENGQDAAFYENLKSTVYGAYGFDNIQNKNPETVYFKGMILRALGALRYVKKLPQWNGKELSVVGGSQGAFQAVSAAAHDQDVTFCDIFIPWLCDLDGVSLGRMRGWRPDYEEGLRYYDTAVQATRLNCPVKIIAGLGDYVCPPSGVTALYNSLSSQKSLEFVQGKTHAYDPPIRISYCYSK